MFPVEIFLSRDVAPPGAMCNVQVHRPFVLPGFVGVVCSLLVDWLKGTVLSGSMT